MAPGPQPILRPADDRFAQYYAEKLWDWIPEIYRTEDGLAHNPGVLRAIVFRANTYVFTSCRSVTFDREGPVGVTGSFRESGTIYLGARTGSGRARLRWETPSDTEIG